MFPAIRGGEHFLCYNAPMNTPDATLTICSTCGMVKDPTTGTKPTNPQSELLATQLTELLKEYPVKIRLSKCLSMCDTPIAWALQSPTLHTTALAPASTAEDLAAAAILYLSSTADKKMNKRELPPALIHTIKSRIPPLT